MKKKKLKNKQSWQAVIVQLHETSRWWDRPWDRPASSSTTNTSNIWVDVNHSKNSWILADDTALMNSSRYTRSHSDCTGNHSSSSSSSLSWATFNNICVAINIRHELLFSLCWSQSDVIYKTSQGTAVHWPTTCPRSRLCNHHGIKQVFLILYCTVMMITQLILTKLSIT